MVGTSRCLVALRPLQRHSLLGERGFKSSAISLQEDSASPSSTSPHRALNAVAALRQNIGQQRERGERGGSRGGRGGGRPQQYGAQRPQQDRGDRPEMRRSSQNSNDRPPRRDDRGGQTRSYGQRQGQGQGQRRDDRLGQRQRFEGREGQGQGQRQGQRRGQRGGFSRRGQGVSRRDPDSEHVSLSPTPLQSVYPVTNWHHAATAFSVGVTRVPYSTPAVTLDTLNKAKNNRPLHEADKAIRLNHTYYGSVMGPSHEPTPTPRPRTRSDDAPRPVRSEKEGSIAYETKEARVKFMQEKFGGDYQRWDKSELLKALKSDPAVVVEDHAAEALIRNVDLGPTHRAWTLNTINTILLGKR